MTTPDHSAVPRRTVLGLAWATPIVVVGVAVPGAAASPTQQVTLSADTSDDTRLPVSLTTTDSLPAGTIFDVDIEGTVNQWAINSSGSTPATWEPLPSFTRGARFSSTGTAPGTYAFVLGLAGIGAYSGTILTVTAPDGQLLARVTL